MQNVGSQFFGPLRRRCGMLSLSLLAFLGLGALSAWGQAPGNDLFVNAYQLVGTWGSTNEDTTGATAEPGEPSHAGVAANATVWFKWTPKDDAAVEFDTFNSAIDTVLAVYTGNTVGMLDQVAANDDINIGLHGVSGTGNYIGPSGVKFNAKANTTYYIAVGSYGRAGGNITLSWSYLDTSSGVFRFSADVYNYADTESTGTYSASTAPSAAGARITITRLFGSAGKVTVNFAAADDTALEGFDYILGGDHVVMENGEMSKSFTVDLFGNTSLTPGTIDFNVSLTGVTLDPLEDGTVLSAPRIQTDHATSMVNIIPIGVDARYPNQDSSLSRSNAIVDIERKVLRCNENGTVSVAVVLNRPVNVVEEIHYKIDASSAGGGSTLWNGFELQAGSDYAQPTWNAGPNSLNDDFTMPYDQATGYGTLVWPPNDGSPKFINIPILNDTLPEFNEDIHIRIFRMGHQQDAYPGLISEATLTILYNDYPAGGLDDAHNPDFSIATDPPRNTEPGALGTVLALQVQPDNKTIIAGNFSAYNTIPRYGIARMNVNGSIDYSFDPGDGVPVKDWDNPSFISALALNANGKILIGGNFPSYNGVERNNVAQLNADGSLDTTFNPGLGANGTVWATAYQPDGKVLIAGEFTTVNGYARSHIARLNPDGSLDQTFDPGTNGPNDTIYALAPTRDGSVFIGGTFTSVNGLDRNLVALLDTNGVASASFTPVKGIQSAGVAYVHALALQPDGKLLVGGNFSQVELRPRKNIARYNADGTLDLSFDPGTGTDDDIYNIMLQADGRIYIAGLFTKVNETHRLALARLFPSGEVDTSFLDTAYNQFAGPHKLYANPYVNPKDVLFTTGLQSDGKVMIGGSFHYVGGGRFTTEVVTNIVAIEDEPAGTRATYRIRNNVARLLGGSTEGPGSIGFITTNYTVAENMSYLYVKIARGNGSLGQTEAVFSVPHREGSNTVGVAQSGVDYVYNTANTAVRGSNPFYDNAWSGAVRERSEGIFGTNNMSIDRLGDGWIATSDDVYVSIINQSGFQGDRSLPLQLDMPSYADVFYLGGEDIPLGSALAKTSASMKIQEADTRPGVISFATPIYTANENGANALVQLVRTNGSVGNVTVRFTTVPGSARPGTDYTAVTNTITFRDGQTSTNALVPLLNNGTVQLADRTVNLFLANPGNGATLGLSNAVLYIIDDDFLPGHINFDLATVSYITNETAPAAIFPVTRTGGNLGIVDVSYATSNLTAVAGVNYVPTAGALHWDDGDTGTRYITVPLLHDGVVTTNLQFYVSLFNASNAWVTNTLGSRTMATNTIVNTDYYGTLQLSAASYNVNENGGYATITVTRTGGSAQTVSASFATQNGAYTTAGVNYVATNGTLLFNPGEVSKSFNVRILDDHIQDPTNFAFSVVLANFTPASTAGYPQAAQVNIIDNQSFNQPPGQIDISFNPDAGFNDDVYSVALQSDGRMVVGGDFTLANGLPVNRITRLMGDGTLDQGFLTTQGGANAVVRSIVNQTDSRMLVGGAFTTMNGIIRNGIARLNYDGTLDTGFNPGSGASGTVYGLAETFVDGARRVVAVGAFNRFNGAQRPGIVQLFNDGSLDTGFNPGLGANGTIYAVAAYPTNALYAGRIVIGGDFTTINGVPRNHIARLNTDGSLDTSFDPVLGPDDTVHALAIQSDGSVLIGGSFLHVNGVACTRLARLKGDGSVDSAFTAGQGANDSVLALALQADNRIAVGGQFTRASGVTRNRLTRLMANGQVDPSINFGTGADNFINTIAIQPNGFLIIGGGFTQYQGQPRAHLARIYGGSMVGSGSFKFDAPTYEVSEQGTNAVITVLRLGGTSGPLPDGSGAITVDFATTDGSARAGVNYSNVSQTLSFPMGETMQSLVVPVIDDQQITPDLTVNLALANPTAPASLGPQPTAVLTIDNEESALTFSPALYTVPENQIDGVATIHVLRQGSTRSTATADFFTTTNGTAVANVNYLPVATNLVFQPGQSDVDVRIPVLYQSGPQGDKTVTFGLMNAINTVLLTPYQGTLSVLDVDPAPGFLLFSQTNYFVGEGDTNAYITVVRTNGHSGIVTVAFSTAAGTAIPGIKYISTNGVLSFGDGEVSKTFPVGILETTAVEGPQYLSLVLSNATGGATITGNNPVPLTILDDDVGVSFAQALYPTTETNGLVTLDVLRLNTTNGTTTVSYATTNGTAVAGVNYVADSRILTFRPGETRKSITLSLIRDPRVTGAVTFGVNLFNPSTGVQLANPSTATVMVQDVDTSVSFLDTNTPPAATLAVSVMENSNVVAIPVVCSNPNAGTVRVSYATADGTAADQVDYTAVSGTLTFTNGQPTTNYILVPIRDNNLVDGNRTFTVSLFSPTSPAQLASPTTAIVTIVDNDSGFHFTREFYDVNQSDVTALVTVERVGSTNGPATVDFATVVPNDPNAAVPGSDYYPTNGTLVFTNGQTVQTFAVSLKDNTLVQPDKTVLLKLSNATGGAGLVSPSSATLTIHNINGSVVAAAGAALLSPAGGVIQPKSTNTVLFAFRNVAGTNTGNLVATLLATNGILSPSAGTTLGQTPSSSYGTLLPLGPSASRPYTFAVNGTNGQLIQATFLLQDNGRAVGTNAGIATFTFMLGTISMDFTNAAQIQITDNTNATPYPSVLTVGGVDAVISKATLTLTNLTHPAPWDIDMLLVSPAGQTMLVMANAGRTYSMSSATLTFDDAATNSLPQSAQITSGTYQPTAYFPVAAFPAPAPLPSPNPYATTLSAFNGSNPNGDWKLFVMDDNAGNAGVLSNGWSLHLTLCKPLPAPADLGLTMTATPEPVVYGSSNITYTLAVTNYGPGDAAGVMVSNSLPAGATFVSAVPSIGTAATNGARLLTWNIGPMLKDQVATLTVVAAPTGPGYLTNSARVFATSSDINADDDFDSVVSTVVAPSADLAMFLTVSPNEISLGQSVTYLLTVTNLGPGTAFGISASSSFLPILPNSLNGAMQVVGASANFVVNNNVITFTNLGNLPAGGQLTATLALRPLLVGTNTLMATCKSLVADPAKANNTPFPVKTVVSLAPGSLRNLGRLLLSSNGLQPDSFLPIDAVLECNSDLSSTNWLKVMDVPAGSTAPMPIGGNGNLFYRIRAVAP